MPQSLLAEALTSMPQSESLIVGARGRGTFYKLPLSRENGIDIAFALNNGGGAKKKRRLRSEDCRTSALTQQKAQNYSRKETRARINRVLSENFSARILAH